MMLKKRMIAILLLLGAVIVSCDGRSPDLLGCLIGYNHRNGRLEELSLFTKRSRRLLPHKIQQGNGVYAPAFDVNTSTLYYRDWSAQAIMSYKRGENTTNVVYDFPSKAPESRRNAVFDVRWLLLDQEGDFLFFIESPAPGKPVELIELSLQTGERRVVLTKTLPVFQRPSWIDRSTLLILLSDFSLARLDIHTGATTTVIEHGGPFTLSSLGSKLFVNLSDGYKDLITKDYQLYSFPDMQLLKEFSRDAFRNLGLFSEYYFVHYNFYFIGEDHVFLLLETGDRWLSKRCLLDLQTLQCERSIKWLDSATYMPECS